MKFRATRWGKRAIWPTSSPTSQFLRLRLRRSPASTRILRLRNSVRRAGPFQTLANLRSNRLTTTMLTTTLIEAGAKHASKVVVEASSTVQAALQKQECLCLASIISSSRRASRSR